MSDSVAANLGGYIGTGTHKPREQTGLLPPPKTDYPRRIYIQPECCVVACEGPDVYFICESEDCGPEECSHGVLWTQYVLADVAQARVDEREKALRRLEGALIDEGMRASEAVEVMNANLEELDHLRAKALRLERRLDLEMARAASTKHALLRQLEKAKQRQSAHPQTPETPANTTP